MSDHEQPRQGGSYRREKDGSLTRLTAEAAAPATETPAAEKPAAGRATTKKEK